MDASQVLRDLGLSIVDGATPVTWSLITPDDHRVELIPTTPVPRLTAHAIRKLAPSSKDRLLVSETASASAVRLAQDGEVSILTSTPARLIHLGRTYTVPDAPDPVTRRRPGRPTWTRWTIERYLVLAQVPARQSAIAEVVQTSQQSVSNTAQHLHGLAADEGHGLVATDRPGLLRHWLEEYAGPRGTELGWYRLDDALEQSARAVEAAQIAGAMALVSGDVAADQLAPWKLPARSRVYLDRLVDLEIDGFVPAPLEEATLITCIPEDPSLWRLLDLPHAGQRQDELPTADPAIVYWDLKTSGEVDSDEAADHLASLLLGRTA